jgi:hypothetical protein
MNEEVMNDINRQCPVVWREMNKPTLFTYSGQVSESKRHSRKESTD